MKNSEFIALLIANTNKTRNIRTYGEKWLSGSRGISTTALCNIGHVIALIQHKINDGYILKNKRNECLLVYNIQPLLLQSEVKRPKPVDEDLITPPPFLYLTLDMLKKPMSEIGETHSLVGTPVQLVVEAMSGEVMNPTKAMLQLGFIFSDDLEENDAPISYGSFGDYTAICGFAAFASDTPFEPADLFTGKLDRSPVTLCCKAYDSILEAQKALRHMNLPSPKCGWVGELSHPKERLKQMVARGMSNHVLKLIEVEENIVEPTSNQAALHLEANIEDEISYLHSAMEEPEDGSYLDNSSVYRK